MTRIVKKADERREEIIKAARELFQTKEYEKATMQELIDTLNIAKGTIYHYYTSKQQLLEAVVEDIVDEELKKKEELLNCESGSKLKAFDKLKILITESRIADDNEKILDSLHHPENLELHTKQLGRYIIKIAPLFASVISEGCDEGVFKTDYPLECSEFILAGVQFITDIGFYPWSDLQLDRRIKALPVLLENLLCAPAGSFDFITER